MIFSAETYASICHQYAETLIAVERRAARIRAFPCYTDFRVCLTRAEGAVLQSRRGRAAVELGGQCHIIGEAAIDQLPSGTALLEHGAAARADAIEGGNRESGFGRGSSRQLRQHRARADPIFEGGAERAV